MERPGGAPVWVEGENAVFPTSFAQERFWFLHQLEGGDRAYNVALSVRLRGALDSRLLRAALEEVVRRHDVLRTRFPLRDGRPVQLVEAGGRLDLAESDLTVLPEPDRLAEAARLARDTAGSPFDLAAAPPARAGLLHIGPDDHVLVVALHHILADGASLGILLGELSIAYVALRRGEAPALPELAIQYADYAIWQRDRFARGALDAQRAYWAGQLAGAPALMDLPTDRKRPAVQSFRGASESFALPAATVEGLRELSRSERATLFMTLGAAFQVFLARLTGQDDVVVGTPVSGRNRLQTEPMIGLFINTLVLRGRLGADPGFRQFLGQFRETAVAAYDHQDLPFEKLVEQLHPARTLTHSPLFQVMFALRTSDPPPPSLGEVTVESFPLRTATAKFDLTLGFVEGPGSLKGSFEYNTDLFDAETVRRWIGHFRTLLESIVDGPGRRVSQLAMLAPEERSRLLHEGAGETTPHDRGRSVARLFQVRAAQTPEAPAIESGGDVLTYGELNSRSNRLARRLRSLGVGRGSHVAICLPRSFDLPVALLGVLKAGAAYVPLDPSHPPGRLRWLLDDAQVGRVLTVSELAGHFDAAAPPALFLDREAPAIAGEPDANLVEEPSPDDVAYLIYTSGSTGTPKGVLVSHRNLAHHSAAIAQRYGLSPEDRVLQFSSVAFDVAAEELFPTWSRGGCVVLAGRGIYDQMATLEDVVEQERLTVVNLPAGFFHEWALALDRGNRRLPAGLRVVATGSDVVSPQAWAAWHRRFGQSVRVFNAYGPTETTITATTYESGPHDRDERAAVPIGQPIANVRICVLDRNGEAVPYGVAGELFIGGEGVALGYWNRPEETAERFVPDPRHPGARRYRTGDRVRRRPDGNLEFAGRLDAQRKIRGFRVEPAEIERVLASHPEVKEAGVSTIEQSPGDLRLVAYLVPRRSGALAPREIRSFLRARLPEPLVPVAFATVESLPRTPSGKLDRGALSGRATALTEPEARFVAPADSLERHVAQIWESVLQTSPIGLHDDFFELGGHSLLAVKLFSEIERLVGRKLPLATLFQAPTVEGIARILRAEGWAPAWSSLVAIQPGGSKPPLYCVHAAGGNVLTYRDLARYLGPDQPVYGLQAQGLDGKQPRHTRVEDLAAHYIREIRNFQPEGPYALCGTSYGGTVAYEMAVQLEREGQSAGLVALFDTHGPGYPRRLPETSPRRVRLYRLLERIDLHWGNLVASEPSERPRYFREKSRRLAVELRQRWKRYLRRRRLPRELRAVAEASRRAVAKYVPRPYAGKVTLFRASKQPAGVYPDPTLGWGPLALGGVEIHEIPGYHGALVYEPRVGPLARELTRCLEAARANAGGASPRAEAEPPAETATAKSG